MNKLYVLDTNVLISDPRAIFGFKEHTVVLPVTVVCELDNLKERRNSPVSKEARLAIQVIDSIIEGASAQEIKCGVTIQNSLKDKECGTLQLYPDHSVDEFSSNSVFLDDHSSHDNRIVNTALKLQEEGHWVCLCTKDINMRIKAKGCGLEHVEDYRNDIVVEDPDDIASGVIKLQGNVWDRPYDEAKFEKQRKPKQGFRFEYANFPEKPYMNSFVVDDSGFCGRVMSTDENGVVLQDLKGIKQPKLFGIQPKNLEQKLAAHLLADEDLSLVALTGPAGSGKTLLALAYGLYQVIEKNRYKKIVISRNTPLLAEDQGFLPGDEFDKNLPALSGCIDNLEVISNAINNDKSVEELMTLGNIQLKSLNYLRGRSFQDTLFLLDEAQNLSPFQMKSIISRCGPNTKIICMGNNAQIDVAWQQARSSGLTHLVEKSRNLDIAGVLRMNDVERSKLAEFAENEL